MHKNEYFFYIIEVQVGSLLKELRTAPFQKYAQELSCILLKGLIDHPDCELNEYGSRTSIALSQEQMARFIYLRNKSGAKNDMRGLNMTRADRLPKGVVDMRPVETDAPKVVPVARLSLTELAQEMDKIGELLDRIEHEQGSEAVFSYFNLEGVKVPEQHLRAVLLNRHAVLQRQFEFLANGARRLAEDKVDEA